MRARSSAARRARGLDARVVRGGAIERENEASVTHHARAQEWRRAAAHDAARGSRARARAGAVRAARTWSGASSQGAGVTRGTPIGFTVGQPAGEPGGPFIQAFNEGIKGMGVGTVRRMIVPPEYAYGPNEVMEIPANGTVTLDLELLSVAKDPITRGVKGAQE